MTASQAEPAMLQDPRFKETFFLVEATSFERHCLWKEWHERIKWEQQVSGCLGQIGTLAGFPVTLSIFWACIDGRQVGFWESPSQVSDHGMVRKWFDKHCNPKWDAGERDARCNAMNFHLCIQAIREANESRALATIL